MKNISINYILSGFQKFETSTNIDGNYVGISGKKVLRIIEKNTEDYREVLKMCNKLPYLIKTEVVIDDKEKIIVEHAFLKNITYKNEWTREQKTEAAVAVIKLQMELDKLGFHLHDPHSFNITFDKSTPVYFDFGSIHKGKLPPSIWFLKSFLGVFTKDYWGHVLGINIFTEIYIIFRLFFSKSPYTFLNKKISRYAETNIDRFIKSTIKITGKNEKFLSKIKNLLPHKFSVVTNWSDYLQKDPLLDNISERTNSIIEIIKEISPEKIIDIGANKGAYTKLALKYGVKEGIAIDLDEFSLNVLRKDIEFNNLPIYPVKLNIMNYEEKPGSFQSYFPAHQRFSSEFGICLAVVHHICYFGNNSFKDFAERISRFVSKIIVIEFIPYTDVHLTGPVFKGKDRSWYTKENFISVVKDYFPNNVEEYPSNPSPRILLKFEK